MEQKKDTKYSIATFLSKINKDHYNALKMHNRFIINNVKIHTPELYLFFSELEILVINLTTKKEETINPPKYLKTYIEAYKEGEQYFEENFKVSPNTMYGESAKTYVEDLMLKHDSVTKVGETSGWKFVRETYPTIVTHEEIKRFGYHSGIVSKLDEQVKKYPQRFATLENELVKALPPQPIPNQKPELNGKLITFNSNETIEKLHIELKGCFLNKEAELLKALQGEQLTELLLFPHNQNRFVEVFKRLKYNSFVLSTPTEIKDWICSNFSYVKTIGSKKTVENFNENSVWDVLTKAKCEPSKKNRICELDWLPFIKQDLRKKEAENEKL